MRLGNNNKSTRPTTTPAPYLTPAELTEWMRPQGKTTSYRTSPKFLHGKNGFSPDIKNKLKALRKDALAARDKKRPAGSNARIAADEKIRLYVDKDATGGGDGSDWTNAYAELADALKYAATPANNVREIWVAWGTYKPLYKPDGTTGTATDQDNAFVLIPGVKIYGGFIGFETSLTDRYLDFTNSHGLVMGAEGDEYATILSGDFTGDDGTGTGTFSNISENAYHVVISAGNVDGAVLDGVIIAGGNASGTSTVAVNGEVVDRSTGGGIAIYNSSPVITNAVVRNNSAASGAAIFSIDSDFLLTNALIVTNQADAGTIHVEDSTPFITNSTIAGNFGRTSGADGAGLYLTGTTTAQIRNSIVYGNTIGTNPNVSLNDASATFSYSIVEGSKGSGGDWDETFGTDGTNDLDSNPLFVDAENGNFALKPASPAINTGNNAPFSEPALADILTDLRGAPRIGRGTIDMGALESRIIRFVDKQANGSEEDGLSWETAYTELADALRDAQVNGDVGEIWVAWGVYNPIYQADDISNGTGSLGSRAFVLVPGVKIYGGFYGDETSIADRDLTATDNQGIIMPIGGERSTILSGDFYTNDGAAGILFNNTTENAYHVVISAGDVSGAVLDGVIIAGGNASSATTLTVNTKVIDNTHGGGIALYESSPVISNVVIRNNQATSGAAIYAKSSTTALTNALIVTNQSNAGGIYLDNSPLVITNATIAGNKGNSSGASGAGIYLTGALSTPQMRNTILYGNTVGTSPNLLIDTDALPSFSYSIVEGSGGSASWNIGYGTDGTNNLDVDPSFNSMANGDFSPTRTSPAVNAGNGALFGTSETPDLSAITTDLRGAPRIYNGAIDIGAVENRIVKFVNKNANPASENGSNWPSAYKELARALKFAATNPVDEIWVAYGTYKPLFLANNVNSTESNNQDNAFVLVPNVKIYGGFTGEEVSLQQRDLRGTDSYGLVMPGPGGESATVLSGDFDGDDGGGCSCNDNIFDNTDDNAYHVVVSAGNVGGAVLDGVIIAGGNASSSTGQTVNTVTVDGNTGGGIALYNSAPKITNVVIRNNQAFSGGAIFASASPFVLTNALVATNQSHFGGIHLDDSAPIITNATIAGNRGDDDGAEGAGIRSSGNSPAEIRNTIVHGNGSSPGIATSGSAKPTFSYSILEGSGVVWNPGFGNNGGDNSNVDPQLYDAGTGAFGLKPTSPAINAGNGNLFATGGTPDLSGITTDVRGTARNTAGGVDIGALESLYPIFTPTLSPSSGRLYVKKDVVVPGDGSSWGNATAELADALFNAAINPAITEIWVAGGVYHPLYRGDNLSNASWLDKFNVFSLVSGVKIYGGFAGTEPTLADRDLSMKQNASILSADLLDDDPSLFGEDGDEHIDDNTYHVAYAVGTTGAVLDGFTVQGSNVLTPLLTGSEAEAEQLFESMSLINESIVPSAYGSAIVLYGPDLAMSNLIVKNNYGFTAALTLTGDESLLANSLLYDNVAVQYGAGITGFGVNMNIINTTITENLVYPFSPGTPQGVGVSLLSGTSKITNSIIYGNYSFGPSTDFLFQDTGDDDVTYSHNIIGGIGDSGCGCGVMGTDGGYNFDEDPLFTDAEEKDFSLLPCSPAINLGKNAFYETGGALFGVTKDLAGALRINQEFADAGALEFQSVLPGLNGSEAVYEFTTDEPHVFESTTDCITELLMVTPTPEVILGNVTTRIWQDNEVKIFNGAEYVQRHFDIEPEVGKETRTATVTLYFTQADFHNFNLLVDEEEYLPTGYNDDGGEADRIANLRIYQFHGKSTGNTGNPASYTGSRSVITPSNVQWNDGEQRWEVTFDVAGFSGFFAGTEAQSPLPVRLVSFAGKLNDQDNVRLDWKVTEQLNISEYVVEYSGNAKSFNELGRVKANAEAQTSYNFVDQSAHAGQVAYYRLKIMEMDGTMAYSRLISVRLPERDQLVVYPVPAKNLVWVNWKESAASTADLVDINGRVITTIRRSAATQQVDISKLVTGVYFLKMPDGSGMKLVKE